MRSFLLTTLMIGVVSAMLAPVHAGVADSRILCSTVEVTECSVPSGCQTQSVLAADIPHFLKIDLKKQTVETIWDGGRVESSVVNGMSISDGLLIFQGVEAAKPDERGAIGWSMSIDEANGRMVLTASGQSVGFTLFGTCVALD